ncbi:Uncharacterised protein [Mycobacteroides abscessus subsp. abscessus]|jgi:hypothetical protein|nr:Uncharacterised protein [Mycobacteroides abscessus subsp. abscessus]SLI09487.1 Uncharacterised protein [Mycobacteroides abscessus subsp. abscessus]
MLYGIAPRRSITSLTCNSKRSCVIDGPVFVGFFGGAAGALTLPDARHFLKGNFSPARIAVPRSASFGVEGTTVEYRRQMRISGVDSMLSELV